MTSEEAVQVAAMLTATERTRFRPAFVFTEADDHWFIDLDGALDEATNQWSERALQIVNMFPGAAIEKSVSGKGLHIIGAGAHAVPEHACKVDGIELYTRGRYCAFGDEGFAGNALLPFPDALKTFVARFGLDKGQSSMSLVVDNTQAFAEDDELIQRMCSADGSIAAMYGAKCHPRAIWNADTAELAKHYPATGRSDNRPFDWSEIDTALMWWLAFWCRHDQNQMLRIFKRWKLYRPHKYEGKGSYRLHHENYGLIPYAIKAQREIYKGTLKTAPATPAEAAAAHYPQPIEEPFPQIFSIQELMLSEAPPVEWLCERLGIIKNEVGMVFARGGTGKTYFLLQLAYATATGRPLMGMSVSRERVLFVSGEDHMPRLQRRLQQIVRSDVFLKMPPAILPPGATLPAPALPQPPQEVALSVVSFAELENSELADADGPRSRVKPTKLYEKLAQVVKDNEITFLILDPVADLYGGDEIIRRQVRSFIALMKRFKCTVAIAAHPSQAGEKSGDGSSGSTGWHGSARWRIYMREDSEEPGVMILENKKVQDGPKPDEFRMRNIDGCFVQAAPIVGDHKSRARTVFLSLLKKYESQGRYVSDRHSVNYAPTVFERDHDAERIKKRKFEEAMNELMDEKIIKVIEPDGKIRSRRIVIADNP